MTLTMGRLENTPVGMIWVAASDRGVAAISLWDDEAQFRAEVTRLTGETPDPAAGPGSMATTALGELDAYLRGELRDFATPIDWSIIKGFQREALERVVAVPYGHTVSYKTIAEQLGRPGSVRAVGQANANNPIPIIIPCHRILGSDGRLHGYGARGGVETKAWLLRLEGSWLI
jgi:methylated-DNA-[protein]-cysteine S-methyltransferase